MYNTKQKLEKLFFRLSVHYYELEQNSFNSNLYSFILNGDLYYDLIEELNKNNFEIFRVRPNKDQTITIVVRLKQ